MTYEEYRAEVRVLAEEMQIAMLCGGVVIAAHAAIDFAEFALAHPEHWPAGFEPDKVQRALLGLIASAEMQLKRN